MTIATYRRGNSAISSMSANVNFFAWYAGIRISRASKPNDPPRLALEALPGEWPEERLLDDGGEEIFVRYKGDPSKERYEFIRDYLDFKIKRMK
jgi:hypothetical protein